MPREQRTLPQQAWQEARSLAGWPLIQPDSPATAHSLCDPTHFLPELFASSRFTSLNACSTQRHQQQRRQQ